jgi:hypothetical protein
LTNEAVGRFSVGPPWLALCLALAVHTAEEIQSGFLSSYSLALSAVRDLFPFVPLPHVGLTIWLAASIGVVAVLASLTPLAYRGARGMRTLMLWVIGLELANVIGHAGGSLIAGRVLPGAYSTILLAGACAYAIVYDRRLARRARERLRN